MVLDRTRCQQLEMSSSFSIVHYAFDCHVNIVAKEWSEDRMSPNKCNNGKNKIVIKCFRTCIGSNHIIKSDAFSNFFSLY